MLVDTLYGVSRNRFHSRHVNKVQLMRIDRVRKTERQIRGGRERDCERNREITTWMKATAHVTEDRNSSPWTHLKSKSVQQCTTAPPGPKFNTVELLDTQSQY